jgi:hypothetical protein
MADETGTAPAQPTPTPEQLAAAQKETAQLKVMAMDWAETTNPAGATGRFDARGLGGADLQAVMTNLADAGFKPQLTGEPGNQSIEIGPEDTARLVRLRNGLIVSRHWEPPGHVLTPVKNETELKALVASMKSEGITPDVSEPGVLRLSAADGDRVNNLTHETFGRFDQLFNIAASRRPDGTRLSIAGNYLDQVTLYSPEADGLAQDLKRDLDARRLRVDEGRGPLNGMAMGGTPNGMNTLIFNSRDVPGAVIRIGQSDDPPDSPIVLGSVADFRYQSTGALGQNYQVHVVPNAPGVGEVTPLDVVNSLRVLKAQGVAEDRPHGWMDTTADINTTQFVQLRDNAGNVIRYPDGMADENLRGRPVAYIRDLNMSQAQTKNFLPMGGSSEEYLADLTKILHTGAWSADTEGGQPVARVDTTGMSPDQAARLAADMKSAGFKPRLDEASGRITLPGDDVMKLYAMRDELTPDKLPVAPSEALAAAARQQEVVDKLKADLAAAGVDVTPQKTPYIRDPAAAAQPAPETAAPAPAAAGLRGLTNEDVEFLIKGKYSLRHVSTRALLDAHTAVADGDAVPLNSMGKIILEDMAAKGEIPSPATTSLHELMAQHGDAIRARFEEALAGQIKHDINWDSGGSTTYLMLVKGMSGTDSPSDMHNYPYGKNGRQAIRPEQVVATMAVEPGDVDKVAAGEGLDRIFMDKMASSVEGLRTGDRSLVSDALHDTGARDIPTSLLSPPGTAETAPLLKEWSLAALKMSMTGEGDEAELTRLAQRAIAADPQASRAVLASLMDSREPHAALVKKDLPALAGEAIGKITAADPEQGAMAAFAMSGTGLDDARYQQVLQEGFAEAVHRIGAKDPVAALSEVAYKVDALKEDDPRLPACLKLYAETYDAAAAADPEAARALLAGQSYVKPDRALGKLIAEKSAAPEPAPAGSSKFTGPAEPAQPEPEALAPKFNTEAARPAPAPPAPPAHEQHTPERPVPERPAPKAAPESSPEVPRSAFTENVPRSTRAVGMSIASLNILVGGYGVYQGIVNKDALGGTLGALNLASGAVQAAPKLAGETAVGIAEKAGVPLMIAGGAYEVVRAPKGEKGAAAARAGLTTAAAGVAMAAGLTGAAALIVPLAAGVAAGLVFDALRNGAKVSDLEHQHAARMEDIRPDTTNEKHLRAVADMVDDLVKKSREQMKAEGKTPPAEDFVRTKDGKIDLHDESNLKALKSFIDDQHGQLQQAINNSDQLALLPEFTNEKKLALHLALEESKKNLDTAAAELNELRTRAAPVDDAKKNPQQVVADIKKAETQLGRSPNGPPEAMTYKYTIHREGPLGKSDSLVPADDRNPPIPNDVLRAWKANPDSGEPIRQMIYKKDAAGHLVPDKIVYWKIDDPQHPVAAAPNPAGDPRGPCLGGVASGVNPPAPAAPATATDSKFAASSTPAPAASEPAAPDSKTQTGAPRKDPPRASTPSQ